LTGGGVVTGSVTAASGSWIEAGSGGSTVAEGYDGGTPTFANDLTLNGDVTNVFILYSFPANALITVAGDLTLNGVSPVLIGHETLPAGRYPLIAYGGTLTGSASANLELGCFDEDSRQTAVLDDSIPGEIDLVVTGSAGNLTWVGDGVSNNWDMTTTNWLNGASPERFFPGDSVVFDDSGSSNPAVNLTDSLAPSSILVDAAGNYTFAGTGDLSATTLIKTNTGTLVLANSGTNAILQLIIEGGTVQVNNWLTGGGGVTVAGGTLGGTGTITGPVTVQAEGCLDADGVLIWELSDGRNLTVSNTLLLTGTTVMGINKAANTNNQVRGITTLTYGGTLVVTNVAGTLATGDSFKLFDATNYTGSFAAICPSTPGVGLAWDMVGLTVNGTLAVVSAAGDKYKANNTTALNQQASWTNHVVPGSTNYGIWTATVTAPNTTNSLGADMTWGGIKIINPGGPVLAASGNTLTLNGVSGTGIDMVGASQDLTLDCGVTLAAGQTWTVATNRMLAVSGTVGGSGSLTKSGFGTLTLSGYNAFSGDVTINQGQLWIKNSYALGTGSKMVTCNNGTLGHCQLHLDGTGGNLTLPSGINFLVSNWADPGTVYNEGGDNAINGNFTITSGGGGLIFLANAGSLTLDGTISANTSGRGVVFDGPADSVANGIISDGTGGSMLLLKTGAGTTTLNAANTYSGTTEVRTGTLAVNGSLATASVVTVKTNATLGGTGLIRGPVTVQAGATLSPGIWELGLGRTEIISNTVSLAGTTVLGLNKAAGTNDQVRGITTLTYGGTLLVTNVAGTLAVGDSFKLFDAANYVGSFAAISPASPGIGIGWLWSPTNGTLSVVQAVATNPTNITWTANSTQLNLAWPADHIGWQLQVQTNNIGVGLSTNWLPVPGSVSTDQMTIPVNRSNGSVFYRLKY
jgi:autotransporter-associated beta strand protein